MESRRARAHIASTATHSSRRHGLISIIALAPPGPICAPPVAPRIVRAVTSRGDPWRSSVISLWTPNTVRRKASSSSPAFRRWCVCRSTSTAPTSAAGSNTATLISGYRGSPLGGLDLTLERNPDLLRQHNVVFTSGRQRGPRRDGRLRAASSPICSRSRSTTASSACGTARARASIAPATSSSTRTSPVSGATAACWRSAGDDPLSKSSTIPSHSEVAFYDALFPVLYPGSAQEILDLGRLGFELLALLRALGRLQDRHQRGRRDRHGRGGARPHRHRRDPGFLYEGRPWQARQTRS